MRTQISRAMALASFQPMDLPASNGVTTCRPLPRRRSLQKPNKQMIEIARKIIEQQEGAFEPEKLEDHYENALRELIRRKEKGEKLVTAELVDDDNVIDLMEARK